jgi:hypothetical protein
VQLRRGNNTLKLITPPPCLRDVSVEKKKQKSRRTLQSVDFQLNKPGSGDVRSLCALPRVKNPDTFSHCFRVELSGKRWQSEGMRFNQLISFSYK